MLRGVLWGLVFLILAGGTALVVRHSFAVRDAREKALEATTFSFYFKMLPDSISLPGAFLEAHPPCYHLFDPKGQLRTVVCSGEIVAVDRNNP